MNFENQSHGGFGNDPISPELQDALTRAQAKKDNPLLAYTLDTLPSLRDRFAMAAMQGLFSSSYDEFWIGICPETKTAQQAYKWADAMLKARDEHA